MILVHHVTPILNVSSLDQSFAWFEKLGWKKSWAWGDPPDFGAVGCGPCEIFLCQDGQGCRGGPVPRQREDDDTGGTWMTWWVGSIPEVDALYQVAKGADMMITQAPVDYPWNTREFHLRHPDGHTFRVSAGLPEKEPE
jgi:catechol 2,3-dioxygenase-like lactoylglutathione lyase family enzyme